MQYPLKGYFWERPPIYSTLDLGDIFSSVVNADDIANKPLCPGFLEYCIVDAGDLEGCVYFPVALK